MNEPYKVKCIDAKYDEDDEILVLSCIFEGGIGQRIVVFNREDFHYKHHGNKVPHHEMHKTAQLFKNKPFYLRVEDDPAMDKMTDEEKEKYADMFRRNIGSTLEGVTEGIQSDARIMHRKQEDIFRGRL